MCNLTSTASVQVSAPAGKLFAPNPAGSGSVMQYKTIDCPTSYLAPGDVIWQQYSTGTNTVTHRYEVLKYGGKEANKHLLTLKDLDTGTVTDVRWPGGDKELCAGPKVDAYRRNEQLCVRATSTSRPRWNPETFETLAPVTGKLPTIQCKTSLLSAGDVFIERPRKHGGGHSEARIEVLEVGEMTDRGFRLRTKNYLNNDISWGTWSECLKTVISGSKCQLYLTDKTSFIHSHGIPVWTGAAAV